MIIGYMLGLYWDNGKENGNYCKVTLPVLLVNDRGGAA